MRDIKAMFTKTRIAVLAVLLVMCLALGVAQLAPSHDAYAGAAVVGQRDGADVRAVVSSGSDRVRRIVYFSLVSHASGGVNTPVASDKVCGLAGTFHFADVELSGTLAGTNPTLTITWQNSKDGGSTWTSVGAWTVINATVTPASQTQTLSDIAASTAVVYGDCWRARYSFAGTGSPAGVFSISGMEK